MTIFVSTSYISCKFYELPCPVEELLDNRCLKKIRQLFDKDSQLNINLALKAEFKNHQALVSVCLLLCFNTSYSPIPPKV